MSAAQQIVFWNSDHRIIELPRWDRCVMLEEENFHWSSIPTGVCSEHRNRRRITALLRIHHKEGVQLGTPITVQKCINICFKLFLNSRLNFFTHCQKSVGPATQKVLIKAMVKRTNWARFTITRGKSVKHSSYWGPFSDCKTIEIGYSCKFSWVNDVVSQYYSCWYKSENSFTYTKKFCSRTMNCYKVLLQPYI